MKRVIKLFTTFILTAYVLSGVCAFANVDSVIAKSDLNKNSIIAVSVRDAKSGKVVYEKNESKLLNPASTLKVFTTKAALNSLGYDYKFATAVYRDSKKNLYIKLSANPMFTTEQLKTLMRDAVAKIDFESRVNTVYIDDTVVDPYTWGIGWMWDDGVNSYMPKFGAYNLDDNMLKIAITPTTINSSASVDINNDDTVSLVNLVKTSTTTKIIPIRQNNILYLNGSVATAQNLNVPVENIQAYFVKQLRSALRSAGIESTHGISFAKVPEDAVALSSSSQDLAPILVGILSKSNNMYAESVFKVAGGHERETTGTIANAVSMFDNYYDELGVKTDEISIVDGSGTSRNDLVTVDWMTNALVKFVSQEDFETYKSFLAKPDEYTLTGRLTSLGGSLWAKTGTLANISSITGYVKTKKGRDLAFAINVQNYKCADKVAKELEDEIIHDIYNNY